MESRPVQKLREGTGPVYHRRYTIRFEAAFDRALSTMRHLQLDPNHFSPQLLAKFEKVKGTAEELAPGDEFYIRITGPWDGPVRVDEVTEEAFRLVTLRDHLEAGEIIFRVKKLGTHESALEIESLARSADWIVDLVFDKVPIARGAQTLMWTQFAQKFATEAAGEGKHGEVEIFTEKRDEETGEWQKV